MSAKLGASQAPPPHWPSKPDYDRHPLTAEEWDWAKHRGVEIALRRLNFAVDLADPRAPDQMALVLRCDLIALKRDWIRKNAVFEEWRQERASPQSIDMVLFCPACGTQHIDAPEPSLGPRFQDPGRSDEWTNPPHRSHLCHACGHIWRPADVATNGVAAINTKGKADSPLAKPKVQGGRAP